MARTVSIALIAEDFASASFDKVAAAAGRTDAAVAKSSAGFSKFAANVSKVSILAAGAVAVASIKMASDFQKSMTLLQTAGGESAGNMKQISAGVLDIAKSTGTAVSQLSDGMYTVAKAAGGAGWTAAQQLNVLKVAAQGAKAENVDLGTATNALTSIMMSYHVPASQAVSTMNELIAGSGAAKTTLGEYAGSLSTVIPVASAAGVSFAQVAGAIATLTQHGTSADESTQELAFTIRNLQAPSLVAQKAMQQLGLNVTDVSTKLGTRGLTGTIQLITNAIASKLGPNGTVLVDTMMKSATGANDLNQMLTKMPPALKTASEGFLTGKVSMADYRKEFRSMGASGSAMGTQFMSLASQVNGFNAQVKSGGPAAQTAAASLKAIMGGATGMNTALMLGGENMKTFTTATNEVAAAGAKSGANISTWAKTQATFAVQMDKAREAVDVFGIELGTKLIPIVLASMTWIEKHKTIVMGLAIAFGTMAVAITAVSVAIKVYETVTKIAAAVTWLWNAAMDANPIGLWTIAIAALAVGLYELVTHFKQVSDFLSGPWGTAISVAVATFFPLIGLAMLVMGHWRGLKNFFVGLWHDVTGAFSSAARFFTSSVPKAFDTALNFFKSMPNRIMGYLKDAGHWLTNLGKSILGGLITGITQGLPKLAMFWLKLPAYTIGFLVGANIWLVKAGIKILEGLYSGIVSAAPKIWSWLTALPGKLLSFYVNANVWLLNVGKDIIVGLFHGISAAAEDVWNWIKGLPGTLHGYAVNAHDWLHGTGLDILRGLLNGIVVAAGDVWTFIKGVPGTLIGYLKDAASWLYDAGKNAITGLAKGMADEAKNLPGQITGIVKNDIVGAFNSAKGLWSHSPSKTMADQVGKWIPAGIAEGMLANTNVLSAASKQIVAQLLIDQQRLTKSITGSASAMATAATTLIKKVITSGGPGTLVGELNTENSKLARLAATRAVVANKFKAANAAFVTAVGNYNTAKTTYSAPVMSSFDITTSGVAADPTATAAAPVTFANMQSQLSASVATAKLFASGLKKLGAEGLSKAELEALAAAGPAALPQVQALLTATPKQIMTFNQGIVALSSAANATGTAMANTMYGAGVSAAQGLVRGLASQQKALTKQMSSLANAMVTQIKTDLKIKSPSQVMAEIGGYMGAGLTNGLKGSYPSVRSATAGMFDIPGRAGNQNGPAKTVNNWYISQQTDPVGTANAVSRRQASAVI